MSATDATPAATLMFQRLAIGAIHGAALYVLSDMAQAMPPLPFVNSWAFTALFLAAGLLPFIWLAAVGSMRAVTLAGWSAVILALVAATAWHAGTQAEQPGGDNQLWLVFPLTIALFIGHHLVAAADRDGRLLAHYATYFDIGWTLGIQLALSLAFLGAFWLVLVLGASLFELIGIKALSELIARAPFIALASALAFALAVHITDTRIALVTGARTMALFLLAWLLPLMTGLAVAFLASLAFTGLGPLWATGSATALLVTAGGVLVVLINAAYQDGEDERMPHIALRLSARVAALALVPIAMIAFQAVSLRVGQYGLTPERVIALAFVGVGAIYATGYAIGAVWPGRWMQPLQVTNVVAAAAWVGLVAGLLTPVADPARLSVNDQVRRLLAGQIKPEAFDFDFLRFDAGTYGLEALKRIASDRSTPARIASAEKATEALARKTRVEARQTLGPDDLRKRIRVFPEGKALPQDFLVQDWSGETSSPSDCARQSKDCQALIADINRDGRDEIILGTKEAGQWSFSQDSTGRWRFAGWLQAACPRQPGAASPNPPRPVPAIVDDIEWNGTRYRAAKACTSP